MSDKKEEIETIDLRETSSDSFIKEFQSKVNKI